MSGSILIYGDPKLGKALRDGSGVLTPTGFRPIEELSVGDQVIDPYNGQSVRVTGVYPQGVKDMFRVSISDGSDVICSGDHLWAVSFSGGPRLVCSTDDLLDPLGQSPTHLPVPAIDVPNKTLDPRIIDIREESAAECTCISVASKERTFITDGYVVTHNTTDVAATFTKAFWIETEEGGLTPVPRALGYTPEHTAMVTDPSNPMAGMQAALVIATQKAHAGEVTGVIIDTLSTWAERLVKHRLTEALDARQAYGALTTDLPEMLDSFLALPVWTVVIAHAAPPETEEKTGAFLRGGPCLPGKKLTRSIPRKFDLVLHADIEEGVGSARRVYRCDPTVRRWITGDRFGVTIPVQEMELKPLLYRILTGNEEPPEEWQRKVLNIRRS